MAYPDLFHVVNGAGSASPAGYAWARPPADAQTQLVELVRRKERKGYRRIA